MNQTYNIQRYLDESDAYPAPYYNTRSQTARAERKHVKPRDPVHSSHPQHVTFSKNHLVQEEQEPGEEEEEGRQSPPAHEDEHIAHSILQPPKDIPSHATTKKTKPNASSSGTTSLSSRHSIVKHPPKEEEHPMHSSSSSSPSEDEEEEHPPAFSFDLQALEQKLRAEWDMQLQAALRQASATQSAHMAAALQEQYQQCTEAIRHQALTTQNEIEEESKRRHSAFNRLEHFMRDLRKHVTEQDAAMEERFQTLTAQIQRCTMTNPPTPVVASRNTRADFPPAQPIKESGYPLHFSFPQFPSFFSDVKSAAAAAPDKPRQRRTPSPSPVIRQRATPAARTPRSVSPRQRKQAASPSPAPRSVSPRQRKQAAAPSPAAKTPRSVSPRGRQPRNAAAPSATNSSDGPARRTRSQTRNVATADDAGDALLRAMMASDSTQCAPRAAAEAQAFAPLVDSSGCHPPPAPRLHAQFLEPCEDLSEGFHQLLMYIINHLQSKVIQTHDELNEVVIALSDVAVLDYPSETTIPIISDRQASILQLISSFYQIVCLISMDEKITPEEVYASKTLMLHAAQRVLTMHAST